MFIKNSIALFLLATSTILSQKVAKDSLNFQEKRIDSIPAELLYKERAASNFTISPNGKFFAKIMRRNEKAEIFIVDIDGFKLHNRIRLGPYSVEGVHWISSNRIIYESSGVIQAIDINGYNSKRIVNRLAETLTDKWYQLYKNFRYNNVVDLMPHRKDEILIETFDHNGHSTIKRVNVFTGDKYVVQSGARFKIGKWLSDPNGLVKIGIRSDDDGLEYLVKNPTKDEWEPLIINIAGKGYPLRIAGGSHLNQDLNFEGFSYKENEIFLSSNIGSDLRNLLRYDLKEGRVVETVLKGINCDISDPHGFESVLIMDKVKKELAGVRYQSFTPKYKWFSEEFNNLHIRLSEKRPSYMHDIIDMDANKERFLVHQWSDSNAGNIGVYDVSNDTYTVMYHFNEELNKYKLSLTRSVIIPARDGHNLPSYLNLPNDYDGVKAIPLVVIPHGGPWARDYWELDAYSQYFASRGYATLRVNFRGSTGFGKTHIIEGLKGINTVMINDIADATKFIKNQYKIEHSDIFMFGHSYGGYATYMSILKYPKLYAAGVAVSAPSDIRLWMKTQRKDKNYFSYEFWNTALGDRGKEYFSQISPINYAKDFKNPLLIFHGGEDETIEVEHAEKMEKTLKKYNKDVTLHIIRGEGHSIWDPKSASYILSEANAFFKKN